MARRFFYICAGMFLLALSYHFGASTAVAQAPGNPAVGITGDPSSGAFAITANGDVYKYGGGGPNTWGLSGNIFGAGPTPALHESWGQLKSRYHTTPAPTPGVTAKPGASDR